MTGDVIGLILRSSHNSEGDVVIFRLRLIDQLPGSATGARMAYLGMLRKSVWFS